MADRVDIDLLPEELTLAGDSTKYKFITLDLNEAAEVDQTKVTPLSVLDARFGSGGASQLTDLSDVNTATPTNRNVLVADGVDWESRALTEADISDLGSYLVANNDLSDLASAATARTNLGLGTIATQSAASVTITGGSISGITDLAIADGGTGQSTAQAAIDALTQVSAATDEHVLTKDTASGNAIWKAAAGGASLTVDTQANILASTPTAEELALATDGEHLWIYDGSDWRVSPLKIQTRNSIDMGAYAGPGTLGEQSNKSGYYDDMITNKTLLNVALGGNTRAQNGALRIDTTQDPDDFEIYLGNQWQTIIYDLTTVNSELEHTPLSETIDVWSGNSNAVGLNGLPIIQEYKVSMGAYPVPLLIDGGSF